MITGTQGQKYTAECDTQHIHQGAVVSQLSVTSVIAELFSAFLLF